MAKRSEKKNQEKINKKKKDGIHDKQLEIIVGIMVGVLGLVMLAMIIIHASNNFSYLGLDFKRVRYGDLIVYSTNIPVFNSAGQFAGYIPLDLRNDPRELKNIPVELGSEIIFIKDKETYLSVGPLAEKCDDSGIGIVSLGLFLKNSGILTKLASNNEEHAKSQNIPYITCNQAQDNTVIMIKQRDKNKIRQLGDNCYEIGFKDCDILKVIEKFDLKIVEQHMGRVTKN